MNSALLTLADSRLPAGGHTHSGGVEQAIAAGVVHDPGSLAAFLRRRLATSGAVAAALATAACAAIGPDEGGPEGDSVIADLAALDVEADARTPSPALRAASRQQGRGLVRVGRRAWPSGAWNALPALPHHPIALGVAAAVAGLGPRDAAQAAAYLSISGPATAAQRLLAMDPLTVAAVTARLAPEIDAVADGLHGHDGPISAATDPLLDLLAEVHAARKDRFFAS
ncbi:urease accessory UreF family protein [Blastococcus sp. CT_GayMR16]|uniref:urease accessory protein UreF n=1 Tax=Blastococcus sp. CT_GayMR16 TaxID=2559607 RepID=UPI0010731818|nr:urease accessory UreF family protein [Blastococcus sp. CT_GayMR16]TFV87131.1 urease accessory protein [Blastococcus sp. CT_GayMR16]